MVLFMINYFRADKFVLHEVLRMVYLSSVRRSFPGFLICLPPPPFQALLIPGSQEVRHRIRRSWGNEVPVERASRALCDGVCCPLFSRPCLHKLSHGEGLSPAGPYHPQTGRVLHLAHVQLPRNRPEGNIHAPCPDLLKQSYTSFPGVARMVPSFSTLALPFARFFSYLICWTDSEC